MVPPVIFVSFSHPALCGMTMRGMSRSFAQADTHMSAMFGCVNISGRTGMELCQTRDDVAMTWTECATSTSLQLWNSTARDR